MNKIGLVITDGVGFKNFIYSDFFKELEATFESVTIFSAVPEKCYNLPNVNIIEIEDFRESFIIWFFRKLKEISHLQLYKKNNRGIQNTLYKNRPEGISKLSFVVWGIFLWTTFFKSEALIKLYSRLQTKYTKRTTTYKKYEEILNSLCLDMLFFTHQRPPYIAPLIYAAEQRGIVTGAYIFSWDNLASKGRMAGNFDRYFVWSDLMKQELLYFYPLVNPKNVFVVGTPQFEVYALNRYEVSKEDFYNKFDVNHAYKIICYSCGDVSTSKNDGYYIKLIAEIILKNQLDESVNFIVRTSPAEDGSRFYQLKTKYPFIRWNFPKWELSRDGHQEAWSQRIPTVEDVMDLRALLTYSDVFLNMCSTMSLDAMCFNKPVINPAFGNPKNGLYDDQKYLGYVHYKRVVKSGAVAIVRTEDELVSAIKEALNNPSLRLKAQQRLLKLQVGKPLSGTSKRFVETLKQVAGEN